MNPRPEMTLSFCESIFAKTTALLQRFNRVLRNTALLHLRGRRAVKSHHVLVERDTWAVYKLLQIGNTELHGRTHARISSRADLESSSHIGWIRTLPG